MSYNNQVAKLYRTVVDDVINNVRESFLDDGVDDQVLMELKQLWETKLQASKAVEPLVEPPAPPPMTQRTVQSQGQGAVMSQQLMGQGHQVPVFAQLPGLSRAASQAAIALPTAVYSQQFAGQQILQTDQGAIILQAPGTQIIRGQVAAGQIRPIQHVLQPGQQVSGAVTTTSSGIIQLDGASDHVTSGLQDSSNSIPATEGTSFLDSDIHSNPCTKPPVDEVTDTTRTVITEEACCSQTIPDTRSVIDKSDVKRIRKKGKRVEIQLKKGMIIEGVIEQIDGQGDSSSEDDDDDDDDDKDDDDDREEEEAEGVEEEPLNSEDDVSDEDATELFDTDNVIVCQYDKINRCKNKWKFTLKDGIMNLNGRDYVFQRASGDAEW